MDAVLVDRFQAEYKAQVEASPLSSLEWLVGSAEKPHEMVYLRVTFQGGDGHWYVAANRIDLHGNESPEEIPGLVKESVNRVLKSVEDKTCPLR
jgi:hypothetical protein